MNAVDRALKERRILITCGTGGVGKTTVSAALAVRAAMQGRNAVVITIDPAKRLATSLGLDELGDHPTDLTPLLHQAVAKARAAGRDVPDCKGKLHAIMPDTRRTFETFVHSLAPSSQVAERVINNPIFQIFAKEFSGTNEYMALERLYALDAVGTFDCIVLDTPPSRNTLAFLDAPKLLARFFEEKLIKWLVMPTNKIVAGGMRKALGILEKLTGAGFMTHLFDFAAALFEVRVSFTANLKRITALLSSPAVGFLVVASPSAETADEVDHFIQTVRDHRFQFNGVILNRTLGYLKTTDAERRQSGQTLARAFEILDALRAREKESTDRLFKRMGSKEEAEVCALLPELARDVHSVEDLFHVAMAFD